MQVPFLLNWYLNPYHAALAVAKVKGFYKKHNIDLCLIEPTNPSEVTKIIGENQIPLGLKAMIHCYAARNRGYPIQSIGTILDEPPTGLISPLDKNIEKITDIQGKRIGYVGEFGKVMIDNLAKEANIPEGSYQMVRTGMDAAIAIVEGHVDAAIGLSCFQQIEVEDAGIECRMLRIDRMAELGCCCFCSIVCIAHEAFIKKNPDLLAGFMQATIEGAILTREEPELALACLTSIKPSLDTPLFHKIFHRCLPFISKDGRNVERDWKKVGAYAERLGILNKDETYQHCYTNQFTQQGVNNVFCNE